MDNHVPAFLFYMRTVEQMFVSFNPRNISDPLFSLLLYFTKLTDLQNNSSSSEPSFKLQSLSRSNVRLLVFFVCCCSVNVDICAGSSSVNLSSLLIRVLG